VSETKDFVKTERIEIRCTPNEKSFLIDMAKKYSLSISQYVLSASIHNPVINDEFMEIYDQIKKNINLTKEIKITKSKSFFLYIDKNAIRRIFDSARFSLFHLGDINMDEINSLLDGYQKIIDSFPDEIKEVKKNSIKELFNFRNKNYLFQKLKLSERQMTQVKKAHSSQLSHISRSNLIEHDEQKHKQLSEKI